MVPIREGAVAPRHKLPLTCAGLEASPVTSGAGAYLLNPSIAGRPPIPRIGPAAKGEVLAPPCGARPPGRVARKVERPPGARALAELANARPTRVDGQVADPLRALRAPSAGGAELHFRGPVARTTRGAELHGLAMRRGTPCGFPWTRRLRQVQGKTIRPALNAAARHQVKRRLTPGQGHSQGHQAGAAEGDQVAAKRVTVELPDAPRGRRALEVPLSQGLEHPRLNEPMDAARPLTNR